MVAIAILICVCLVWRVHRLWPKVRGHVSSGNDVEKVLGFRLSDMRPSVLVLYSLETPAEEVEKIHKVLVGGLSTYDITVDTPDTVGPRELSSVWIEAGLREREAVLLVCNRQFQSEWEAMPPRGELYIASAVKVSCILLYVILWASIYNVYILL